MISRMTKFLLFPALFLLTTWALGGCAKSVDFNNPGGVPRAEAPGQPIPQDPCSAVPAPMLGTVEESSGGWVNQESSMCGMAKPMWICADRCGVLKIKWNPAGTPYSTVTTVRGAVNFLSCAAEIRVGPDQWFGYGDPTPPETINFKGPVRWVKERAITTTNQGKTMEISIKPTAGCKIGGLGFIP